MINTNVHTPQLQPNTTNALRQAPGLLLSTSTFGCNNKRLTGRSEKLDELRAAERCTMSMSQATCTTQGSLDSKSTLRKLNTQMAAPDGRKNATFEKHVSALVELWTRPRLATATQHNERTSMSLHRQLDHPWSPTARELRLFFP